MPTNAVTDKVSTSVRRIFRRTCGWALGCLDVEAYSKKDGDEGSSSTCAVCGDMGLLESASECIDLEEAEVPSADVASNYASSDEEVEVEGEKYSNCTQVSTNCEEEEDQIKEEEEIEEQNKEEGKIRDVTAQNNYVVDEDGDYKSKEEMISDNMKVLESVQYCSSDINSFKKILFFWRKKERGLA